MRFIGLAFLSLLVAAPIGASVYSDFVKVWEERDRTYRSEREALERRAQSTADRSIESLVGADPAAGDDLVVALSAAWTLSELVGRGQMLYTFREHMAARPSAALSELWLQGKVDELRRKQAEADTVEGEMEFLQGHDTISVKQWIAAHERLAMLRGNIAGQASELSLINQNLTTYYRAREDEVSPGRTLLGAALLGLLAGVRDAQDNTQQRSAACVRTGACR